MPQLCIPPLTWNNKTCTSQKPTTSLSLASSSPCPPSTFFSNNKCLPYINCKDTFTWDSVCMRCVCPIGTFYNGNTCTNCGNNRYWVIGAGCVCMEGMFDINNYNNGLVNGDNGGCEVVKPSKCQTISNAIWNNNTKQCVCRPGFMKSGLQCICIGT